MIRGGTSQRQVVSTFHQWPFPSYVLHVPFFGAATKHLEGYMSMQLIPVPHPRIGAPFVAAIVAVVFAGGVVTGLSLARAVENGSQGAAAQGHAVQGATLAPVRDRNMSDAAYQAMHGPAAYQPRRAPVGDHNMSDAAYAAFHGRAIQGPSAPVGSHSMSDAAYAAMHGPAANPDP